MLPGDTPTPLVNYVRLTHCVYANLFHDQLSGSFVTGILRFINKNPLDWYYNKHINMEIATYSSEFFCAHTCV